MFWTMAPLRRGINNVQMVETLITGWKHYNFPAEMLSLNLAAETIYFSPGIDSFLFFLHEMSEERYYK